MSNVNQNQGTWAEPSQLAADSASNPAADDALHEQRSVSGTADASANEFPYGQTAANSAVYDKSVGQNAVNSAYGAAVGQSASAPTYGTAAYQQAPSAYTGAPAPYVVVQNKSRHVETEETKRLKENYNFFGPAAFLYAIFYTFCMFRNGSGVTFPFFVAGSLLLLYLSLSKLGTTLKSGSVFYMVSMMLLGISTFLTDDWRIIAYNKLGIFLLLMSLLLKQFFDTTGWKLGKYLCSIIQTVVLSFGELLRPVQDGAYYQKSRTEKKSRTVGYVLIGFAVSVPLLLIVLALLASADAVFFEMIVKVFGSINLPNIMNIIFRIAVMFFFSYMLIAYLCKKQIKEEVKDHRTGEPVIAITVTAMLTFVYLIFSVVQIAGLFLGQLKLPEGYTYAGYARQGFFQLLAVSILNLIIVLVCMSYFRESKVLKVVLTMMSLCTFIMIASSAMRMIIYIRFYYLTFLRVLVLWALALLAVLFLGILVNIYAERFPLFRYSMVVVTVFYLALSFAHPDYIIARVNIANAEADNMQWWVDESVDPYHDFRYLSRLSADAAPVMVPYLESLGYDLTAFESENILAHAREQRQENFRIYEIDGFGYWWMENLQERTENFGIRTFNLSRYYAMRLLKGSRLNL